MDRISSKNTSGGAKSASTYRTAEKELLQRYSRVSPGTALYVRARLLLGHYRILEKHVPASGRILDFGCGLGQLGIFLKLTGAEREIYGYDHSKERIETATKVAEGIQGINFTRDKSQIPSIVWKAVVFFDVLHYMKKNEQDELVAAYAKLIEPGGAILIRDVHASPGFRYFITKLHERIMVVSGFTPTESRALHFRDFGDFEMMLSGLGFETKVIPPPPLHPYADYLLAAVKK